MMQAGMNRVWVEWDGRLIKAELDGVRQLHPEWQTANTRLGRAIDVGEYDGYEPDRSMTQARPWARSRALRRAELAAPGWTEEDLDWLEGADVIFSYSAITRWLDAGIHGENGWSYQTLYNLQGMAVPLNLLRAWKDPVKGWRNVPGERLIVPQGDGVGLDVVNSVYLLFEGPALALNVSGLADPELSKLYTVAEYQVRATLEKKKDDPIFDPTIPATR